MYPKGAILYHQDFHFPVQRLYWAKTGFYHKECVRWERNAKSNSTSEPSIRKRKAAPTISVTKSGMNANASAWKPPNRYVYRSATERLCADAEAKHWLGTEAYLDKTIQDRKRSADSDCGTTAARSLGSTEVAGRFLCLFKGRRPLSDREWKRQRNRRISFMMHSRSLSVRNLKRKECRKDEAAILCYAQWRQKRFSRFFNYANFR